MGSSSGAGGAPEAVAGSAHAASSRDEVSLLAVAIFVLRRRRLFCSLGLAGALLGLLIALLGPPRFESSATLLPQRGNSLALAGGLAAAASQLGIMAPSGEGSWDAGIYAALLRSPAFLAPIAADTLAVAEQGGRRVSVTELFGVSKSSPALTLQATIRELSRHVQAEEDRQLGAVRMAVTTRWASVSFELANRLVAALNGFNIQARTAQADAEFRFIGTQVEGAEQDLRLAENQLQDFIQRNRNINGSPELQFERDRLERNLQLRQQLYESLLQSQEDAAIRRARDTPVLTVLEAPMLPAKREGRGTVLKFIAGGLGGALIATIIGWIAETLQRTGRAQSEEARELLDLFGRVVPGLERRRRLHAKRVNG